jgi:hypothetical protein
MWLRLMLVPELAEGEKKVILLFPPLRLWLSGGKNIQFNTLRQAQGPCQRMGLSNKGKIFI